jgi:hypothetical protein
MKSGFFMFVGLLGKHVFFRNSPFVYAGLFPSFCKSNSFFRNLPARVREIRFDICRMEWQGCGNCRGMPAAVLEKWKKRPGESSHGAFSAFQFCNSAEKAYFCKSFLSEMKPCSE